MGLRGLDPLLRLAPDGLPYLIGGCGLLYGMQFFRSFLVFARLWPSAVVLPIPLILSIPSVVWLAWRSNSVRGPAASVR